MLIDAGLAVLRRTGYERATLDEILGECGLGTRAFYRHFQTKDELLLVIYRLEADAAVRRIAKRVAADDDPLVALAAWVDDLLSIAFDSKRSSRAKMLWSDGARGATGYHDEHQRSMSLFAAPLVPVLEAGLRSGVFPRADPEADARTINAIAWSVIAGFPDDAPRLAADTARDHVLRFALGALGHRD